MKRIAISHTADVSRSDIDKAVAVASQFLKEIHAKEYPNSQTEMSLTVEHGATWHRLVKVDALKTTGEPVSRSAWGFCDNAGNLWKSAGWKAPAKNKARGVLSDLMDKNKVFNWRYSIS